MKLVQELYVWCIYHLILHKTKLHTPLSIYKLQPYLLMPCIEDGWIVIGDHFLNHVHHTRAKHF